MTNLHDAKTRLREAIEQCADDEMSPTMRADIKCVLDFIDGKPIDLPKDRQVSARVDVPPDQADRLMTWLQINDIPPSDGRS